MKHFFTVLLLASSATAFGQTVVYADLDGDGYGDPNSPALCTEFGCPIGYVTNNYDCDDNNKAVNPNIVWYKDADNDGYTDGTTKVQCERPIDYKLFSEIQTALILQPDNTYKIGPLIDCNDASYYEHPFLTANSWYLDADNDGYANLNGPSSFSSCLKPGPNYISEQELVDKHRENSNDCNDNNALEHPDQKWYKDQDGDHYISDPTPVVQCNRPTGYIAESEVISLTILDCDDNDASKNPASKWYKDSDNDGYTDGTFFIQCEPPAGTWITSSLGFDCNDNDPLEHENQVWYRDNDGDKHAPKFGEFQIGCTRPSGFFAKSELLSVNDDCDDNDPSIYPGAPEICDGKDNDCNGIIDDGVILTYYRDADKDGWGDPNNSIQACSQPEGYILVSGDCDDNNPILNPGTIWYKDLDNDGYSDGTSGTTGQCEGAPGFKLASELIATSGDCDDNDPTVWQSGMLYVDNDHDGYDNGQQTMCYGNVPVGYSLTSFGSDCDDNDPQVHSPFTFYFDGDHDGYGDPNSTITSCSITHPKGYVTNGNDCDDENFAVNPTTIWYKDADNDGYSDGTTQTQCTRPANYKLASELTATSGDCDDNDASLNAPMVWYKDADNDGYSDGTTQTECSRPAGYKLPSELLATSGDCDDNDPNLNLTTAWFKDADNDGYSDGITVTQCQRPAGYKLLSELISMATDCSDNDPSVWRSGTFYIDKDGDGYDNGQQTVCYGTNIPSGYLLTTKGSDCNDNDAGVHSPKVYYQDADHDGYGNPAKATTVCSSPPSGYVSDNTDCNDNNAKIHSSQTYYQDADHDGYGNPAKSIAVCSSTAPFGYVSDKTDCNDNDTKVHSSQTYYRDYDRDRYGSADVSITICSSKPPSGYVSNNSDCNDSDAKIHSPVLYYVDNDHDGYGSKTTALLCTSKPPVGYSTNNKDCDDNNAAVNPASREICGNAIDDNCNGKIDEGCDVCQDGSGLTTTNITKSSAQLNWTTAASPIEWELDYKKSSSFSWLVVLLPGSARSTTISSLTANQNYNWRLKALCGNKWTTYSNTINFKTTSYNNNSQVTLAQPAPEQNTDRELQLFPNPNNGEFTILLNIDSQTNEEANIQMVDMVGRIVHSENGNITSGKLQKTMTMSSLLTRGIYIVRIISKDNVYLAKLICEK